jgi:serine/threonine-protein kinase
VDGIYYMVMEYARGQSAREILNAEGLLAPAQAADILIQVLSALDHAHRQGIVHRDIKPENVMVTREGVVKVADFGLARAYADAQITEAGTVTGTVQYLAPEQLQGEPADPRTDLYSLGVVAYELLTGRLPFTGETPMAIAYKHLHERVPAPSSSNPAVPPGLDGWVSSMTEKERELRPESAAEARRDLEVERHSLPAARSLGALVPEVTVHPVPPSPGRAETVTVARTQRRERTRSRRRRVRWSFGILLTLAALGAAAWGAWTYLIPHEVDVPPVVGQSVPEAQARLERLDLVVRIADGDYSRRVAEGSVLRIQPAVGTTLREGDRVTIVPSLGPPPVDVPDLVGKTLPKARELLRGMGLELGDVTRGFSDDVAIDRIIDFDRGANGQAPYGSAIDVVLSKGPFPVAVPRVVRMTQEDAAAALAAAGFEVSVTEDFSEDVPRGVVISQDPPRGTELQPGNTVAIVVSLGPPEFPMPNVVGMSKDEAVQKLTDLGLLVDVVLVRAPGTTVVFQKPVVGAIVQAGDVVHIYVA